MRAKTKTAALAAARRHCAIWGRGTSWTVSGPWDARNPRGPSTEHQTDSYTKAVRVRTTWRARIALAYMGKLTLGTSYAVDEQAAYGHDGSLRALVEAGLAAWEPES